MSLQTPARAKIIRVNNPSEIYYARSDKGVQVKEGGSDVATEVQFDYVGSGSESIIQEEDYYVYFYDGTDEYKIGRYVIKKVVKKWWSAGKFIYEVTMEDYLGKLKNAMIERDFGSSYDGEIIKVLISLSGLSIDTTNVDNIDLYNTYSSQGKGVLQVLKELAGSDKVYWIDENLNLYFKSYSGLSNYRTYTDSDILAWGKVGKDSTEIVYRVKIYGAIIGGQEIYAEVTKSGVSEDDANRYCLTVIDRNITDTVHAKERAQSLLAQKQDVLTQVEIEVLGDKDLRPGYKITMNSSIWNINDAFRVLEVNKKVEKRIFKLRITAGSSTTENATFADKIDEKMRQVIRSLTEIQKLSATEALSEPTEIMDKDEPIEPDYYDAGIVVDMLDEYVTLTSGSLSGIFKIGNTPDRETFLCWRRLSWEFDVKEGSVQVDVIDARDIILFSNISSPFLLIPFPANMDFAESLPSEWSVDNGTLANSRNAVFGTFSMKYARINLSQEGSFRRNFTARNMINAYRFLHFNLLTDAIGSLEVRLYTTPWDYYKRTFSADKALEWLDFLVALDIGTSWTAVGSPSMSSIAGVGFYVPAASTAQFVYADGFRFEKMICEPAILKFTLSRPAAGNAAPQVYRVYWNYEIGGVWT